MSRVNGGHQSIPGFLIRGEVAMKKEEGPEGGSISNMKRYWMFCDAKSMVISRNQRESAGIPFQLKKVSLAYPNTLICMRIRSPFKCQNARLPSLLLSHSIQCCQAISAISVHIPRFHFHLDLCLCPTYIADLKEYTESEKNHPSNNSNLWRCEATRIVKGSLEGKNHDDIIFIFDTIILFLFLSCFFLLWWIMSLNSTEQVFVAVVTNYLSYWIIALFFFRHVKIIWWER